MPIKRGTKPIAQNKKARHEYFIEETYECGLVLLGTEVKSIRAGKVNLKDSYAKVENGEMLIIGMHISPYEQGNINNRDPFRTRKLLLHKREILKLLDFDILTVYVYTLFQRIHFISKSPEKAFNFIFITGL